jgi:16S rRNA (guanine527-N7)-methyltransferase
MKGQQPNEEIDALQALTPWFVQAVQPLIVPELESQRCLVLMRRKGNE